MGVEENARPNSWVQSITLQRLHTDSLGKHQASGGCVKRIKYTTGERCISIYIINKRQTGVDSLGLGC